MDIHNYLAPLKASFYKHTNAWHAAKMQAYLRDHFQFLGIKQPERKKITRLFFKTYGKPDNSNILHIAFNLWEMPEREFQYVAIDLMRPYMKKPEKHALSNYLQLIASKSWWDTVDLLATNAIGSYFLVHPENYKQQALSWINSSNLWIRRSALLFQLKYKEKTDENLLTNLIEKSSGSSEFFIQKAIGWSLREYSKTHPEWVSTFVAETPLPPLGKREALKWMKQSRQSI